MKFVITTVILIKSSLPVLWSHHIWLGATCHHNDWGLLLLFEAACLGAGTDANADADANDDWEEDPEEEDGHDTGTGSGGATSIVGVVIFIVIVIVDVVPAVHFICHVFPLTEVSEVSKRSEVKILGGSHGNESGKEYEVEEFVHVLSN